MNRVLYAEWEALSGKAAIDKFFENYEKDPLWIDPDGNPTDADILKESNFLEAARQVKIVARLEDKILSNLKQTEDVILETMLDPSFEVMGSKLIAALNVSRKQMTDILNEKKEEIGVLLYGYVPWNE